jgi:hypothetical protein
MTQTLAGDGARTAKQVVSTRESELTSAGVERHCEWLLLLLLLGFIEREEEKITQSRRSTLVTHGRMHAKRG